MKRLEALLKMYDVNNWSCYDLIEKTEKGNKFYNLTFSFASKYETTFEINIFKSTLYINGVKCTVFSKSFIKNLYYEIDNFMNLTK